MNSRSTSALASVVLALGAGLVWALTRKPPLFNFRGKTVVITGGARGLGLLMARRLAREGANLALIARDPEALRVAEAELTAAGAKVLALRCDIRKRDQVDHAMQQVIEQFRSADVLINNAGVIQVGPLEHMTAEDFEESIAVHFYGPLFTTLAVLPHMRKAGAGRIVNIASIGGKIGVPHLTPYCAGKFALVGFSDSLRAEVWRHNILVTTVIPGLMRTGSPPNANFKGRHKQEYAWFALCDSLPLLSMNAERAAAKIIDACREGAARATIGVNAQAAVLMNELFPGMSARLSAWANCVLPDAEPSGSKQLYSGWDSQSDLIPSWLTRLSDRATARNNEQPTYG